MASNKTPLKGYMDGIDISAWQDTIDITKVPCDFVIVKATEGTDYKNRFFAKHCDQAMKAGKLLGAFHYANAYAPLTIRSAIIPAANIGSAISWPLILIGLLIPRVDYLITLGIILFSLVVVLQFVTLPVEFNASRRAMAILEGSGYLYPDELKGARSVLTAAAMTYVAAMVSASLQLLRLVLLFGNRRR